MWWKLNLTFLWWWWPFLACVNSSPFTLLSSSSLTSYESKLLSQYLLMCCRKNAISLLISIHWQIIHSFFSLRSLNCSSKVRQWSEGKLKRRKKFAKITWLFFIPDISSHLLLAWKHFFTLLTIASDHDWTSRIILSLIDQSLIWWQGKEWERMRERVGKTR